MSSDQIVSPDLNCRWRVTEDGYIVEFNGEQWQLEDVAAAVWSHILEGATLGETISALVARYDAPAEDIEADVREFVRELSADGLVHEEPT
ncbi:hypothetical protein NtRootA4_37060 [Arthrobacter sp. NtRootA4]|uniref:PqqD family protein n=1 Tax=Paenarthrobacter TaxID=1742992 RepID=UPI000376AD14|nr:hypothetical protein NtRootA2_39270 [Arthrobacter sp. NtRootA2]BCW16727.1 hypothetical protein NtRootA4_37060 [Arthrobacter sp. NtRootA4]BCW25060.1 hypothetical protein NtRootC7_39270 [Arthrobacter sp. NtRootC7]BCW29329.1 hypothetical protein NtRootC45_39290 [Arthrobacter sp. NtRootC45]BCW33600.1 hypothetical protein NtRootD5_39310 [Arthrobacter sp. NtRootD5]